jgi:hypothetical protein
MMLTIDMKIEIRLPPIFVGKCEFGIAKMRPVLKADIITRVPINHLFGERSHEVRATSIIQPGINTIQTPTTLRSKRPSNIFSLLSG